MFLSPQERSALQDFKKVLLERFRSQVSEIFLFGSKARGDSKSDSDIDVLVITQQDDWKLKDKIGRLATDILLDEGIYLSIKVLGQKHYQYMKWLEAPFIKNVLKEGILV
ncbi:MAG: nucleotidyltransferase domain-containing protein [Chlamydiae bacterium]|nr:nucleotidyltransferase domain-containing protein [Chlamydiota bacterium]MBI3265560.1 nucleotidyltransferase domain-containing protein [Chlamydiota bacterium]